MFQHDKPALDDSGTRDSNKHTHGFLETHRLLDIAADGDVSELCLICLLAAWALK